MRLRNFCTTLTQGFAIFSMFFGAGNVIFPLALGVQAGEHFNLCFLGLILTSIGAPLLGLYGALLYEGDLKAFFAPLGRHLSILMILILVIALGPLGAMPRCLTLTHSALTPLFPDMSLPVFTAVSAVLILGFIFKRQFLLPVLGRFLSPVLLTMLFVIVSIGVMSFETSHASMTNLDAFSLGFHEGYLTMDLLAAILFSIIIWRLVKDKQGVDESTHSIYKNCIHSGLIAGAFLAMVYVGLGMAAKANANVLQNVSADHLLGALSLSLLGPRWSMLANITVALACFTTIISLAVAAVDVLWQTFSSVSWLQKKETPFYTLGILIITVVTALFANLGFKTVSQVIGPIVTLCYPAIIVLTLCNILHKKVGFNMFKVPTFGVLGVSVLSKLFF